MLSYPTFLDTTYPHQNTPLIDSDFDRSELLNDAETGLINPHTGHFYYDAFFVNA